MIHLPCPRTALPLLCATLAAVATSAAEPARSKVGEVFGPALRRGTLAGILMAAIVFVGTWGAVHDTRELTYMNLVHLAGCDGTNPDSMTKFEIEGRHCRLF